MSLCSLSLQPSVTLLGCPSTLLSENSSHFFAQLATAEYKLLGIHKLTTSTYHPNSNGSVQRVIKQWRTCLPSSVTNTMSTGALIDSTSNTPTIIPSARPPALPPMKFLLEAYCASLSPSLIVRTVALSRASTPTCSPLAISPVSTNSAPTNSCENSPP